MGQWVRFLSIIAVSAGALAGCGNGSSVPSDAGCPLGEQLEAATGTCEPVTATCEPEVVGSIVGECEAAHRSCVEVVGGAVCGACVAGYKGIDGECVGTASCSDIDCEAVGRSCIEGSTDDATCGPCLVGRVVVDGMCVAENCAPGDVAGSRLAECTELARVCFVDAEGADCGECRVGYREGPEGCQPVRTCAALDCVTLHRTCVLEGDHSDARCEACRAGYVDVGGRCEPLADATCDPSPAVDSILDACASEGRTCDAGAPASCGACTGGLVEDPVSGACVEPRACAELDCAAIGRECLGEPTARCGGCLAGRTDEGVSDGSCREFLTCDDVACADGEVCDGSASDADAFCRIDCGDGAIWGGARCEPCPACDGLGEVGVWPEPTATGNCICETAPGYFYSVGADVGPYACDADDDGWVRESARIAIESPDPSVRSNARCDLRSIDEIVLQNERGQSRVIPLPSTLPLYESDRNDDDVLLNAVWGAASLPQYGGSSRRVTAAELNRFTKLCHDPRTDYNDNGVADVREWGTRPLSPTMRTDQAPFNEFSYFTELHWGAYEPPAAGSGPGRWRIAEKSRQGSGPVHRRVGLRYEAGDDLQYWRQCEVRRDSEWETLSPPVGMDLAPYYSAAAAGSWAGMTHHSLFKCLIVDSEPDPAEPTEVAPDTLCTASYGLNQCQSSAAPVGADGEPAEMVVECALADAGCSGGSGEIEAGDVVWAVVPYTDYDVRTSPSLYERGCVNECEAALPECPSFDCNPAGVTCEYGAWGKLEQCVGTEVCDGCDNDDDGSFDEGGVYGAEGGTPCQDTRYSGACRAGVEVCTGGELVCTSQTAATGETCNGVDDDCDGAIDEDIAVVACSDTSKLGACRSGERVCTGGSLVCNSVVAPTNEICNGVDDDCDGAVDESDAASKGTCLAPFTWYYRDQDGDGYGDKGNPDGRCLCAPATIGGVKYTATNADDCCDKDYWAKPGSNSWRGSTNACGLWDWNCDGRSEQAYTAVDTSAGCGICAFCGCNSSASGWTSSPPPACGQTATAWNGCTSLCAQKDTQRKQLCR